MSTDSDLVSKAVFGRKHRLGPTRMRRLIAEGLPLRNGKVPAKRTAAWLEANIDSARKDHWNGEGADASLAELRRQREAQKVEAGRLELQRAAGEVVERAAVKRFIVARAQMERDGWLAWSSAAAARIAAAIGADTGRLFALLESEVRDQLRRLAAKALPGDDSDMD